ncbi:hypothetical protein PMIN04_007260 [Paraphaeosphaeria minitans]
MSYTWDAPRSWFPNKRGLSSPHRKLHPQSWGCASIERQANTSQARLPRQRIVVTMAHCQLSSASSRNGKSLFLHPRITRNIDETCVSIVLFEYGIVALWRH